MWKVEKLHKGLQNNDFAQRNDVGKRLKTYEERRNEWTLFQADALSTRSVFIAQAFPHLIHTSAERGIFA